MATINLTVDATQAKTELYQVNEIVTGLKLNTANISLGGQNIPQQLQAADSAAQKLNNTQRKVAKTSADTTLSVVSQTKSITGETTNALGKVRNFLRGMASTWTAIIMAVEAAAYTFKYFFTNLTESIDKLTTRGQSAIKVAQRNLKAVEKRTKESSDLIQKLDQLNKIEQLNTDQQRLANSIVDRLNKSYGDLGITLDQTTGKYRGLYEAQLKIDERQRRAEQSALKNKIDAQRDVANAALAKTFGRGISLDQVVNGKDFFTLAERMGGTLGAQNADLLAKKWNSGSIENQIDVLNELIQGLSSSESVLKNAPEALDALETLKDYKDQLQELNSVETLIQNSNQRLADSFKEQRDAIQKTKEAVDGLQQSYEDQQRANSLAGLDPEDRANALRGEVELLQKKNAILDQAIQLGEQQAKPIKQNSDAMAKILDDHREKLKNAEAELEDYNKQLSDLISKRDKNSTEINTLKDRLAGEFNQQDIDKQIKLIQQNAEINKQITQIQTKQVAAQKELTQAKKDDETIEKNYQAAKAEQLKYDNAIVTLEEQRQKNLNAIQQKEQQIADINKDIEEAKRKQEQEKQKRLQKQQQAIEDITSSLEKQIEAFNKTDLEKKIEDALAGAQSAKGELLTQDEVDRITYLVTQLDKMNQLQKERQKTSDQQKAIEGVFANYQQSQTLAYMKLVGKQKEAVLLEAKLNAEKSKGAKLTEQQYESLKNYVDVQQLIEEANSSMNGIQRQGQKIITNQLAQKGGFASSVVVDRARDVSKQILAVQQRQYDLQNQIKNAMDKYSVIQ